MGLQELQVMIATMTDVRIPLSQGGHPGPVLKAWMMLLHRKDPPDTGGSRLSLPQEETWENRAMGNRVVTHLDVCVLGTGGHELTIGVEI
jgi:hypothetical protein